MPDPRLKTYAPQAIRHLTQAGSVFVDRQSVRGGARGNVPPWPGSEDLDFHGTLAAIWVWARHQRLSGDRRFVAMRSAGWAFVESVWKRFIPEGIDSGASDEAAYDCALALLGAVGERAVAPVPAGRQALIDGAARVLSTYLADLETPSEREFRDPGFLAWALIEYARTVEDRGLLASGRKFVERAFGMKAPPPFATEPAASGGLFDFSSTTATRVLAIIAAEGNTPFVGAWLRERVARHRARRPSWRGGWTRTPGTPASAWALGRAYVVSTDPMFLQAYTEIMDELERRDGDRDGALGRDRSIREPETAATFYYALAVDALITGEHLSAAPSPGTPHGPRPPTPGSGGLHGRR